MKALLDECIPRKLKNSFTGHDCQTVPEAGFAGKKNGEMLLLAEQAGFDAFLTIDSGLEHQQNLSVRRVAVIIIQTKSSRPADLLPLVSEILRVLQSIRPGELVRVGRKL